tara:strand:- start:3598 stop:4119 length:522 start_codon:yes stop_codon:yes gene_type:complete
MASDGWTNIVIKALTIITIVWWLLTVVSKSIDYPYADAWVYTMVVITMIFTLFHVITSNLNDQISSIFYKTFITIPIFIELFIMIFLTKKYVDIFTDVKQQFSRMNTYNSLIFVNVMFQFIYYSVNLLSKGDAKSFKMMSLLLSVSFLITFICITELYLYLKFKKVDKLRNNV